MTGVPDGFVLHSDFLSPDEERELLAFISTLEMGQVRIRGIPSRRFVRQYGAHYSFDSFHLTPAPDIPHEFLTFRERAARIAEIEPAAFAEALVTAYPPGAGIGWHRDAPPFGLVAGISLAGSCRLRFQKGTKEDRITAAVDLPPRSLYLITGPARSDWQHMIPPVKADRYSITFRTLRSRSPVSTPAAPGTGYNTNMQSP